MKLFGVTIANGFSSEVSAGTRALGTAAGVQSLFAVHAPDGDRRAAQRVSESLGARGAVATFDAGWRPNPDGTRKLPEKVGSWARLFREVPGLIATARRFEPDLVYSSQQHWDCTAATLVAAALRKPQVIHLHYVPGPWLGRLPMHRLKACAQVVAVSEFTRGLAIRHGVAPERVVTVLNSVPSFAPASSDARQRVRAALGISESAPVAGLVARLSDTKGQRESIEAFARIASEFADARLVLVGEGPERGALQQLVTSRGLDGRVLFTGPRADVSDLLRSFDVFVHPSYQDPCPLAVLEAQAAGLPVVAFSDGGVPEQVVHEETGLLSPPREIDPLAAHLRKLFASAELAARLGRAGAERVRHVFNVDVAGAALSSALARVQR